MLRCALVILAVVFGAPTFAGEQSSFEDFVALGDALRGHWLADVTVIAAAAGGHAEQDGRVTRHMVTRWAPEKHGFVSEQFFSGSHTTSFTSWDADTGTIKQDRVDSDGTISRFDFYRRNGVWQWELAGTLRDGRATTGSGTLALLQRGARAVWEGVVAVDGEKLPSFQNVYTRISKTSLAGTLQVIWRQDAPGEFNRRVLYGVDSVQFNGKFAVAITGDTARQVIPLDRLDSISQISGESTTATASRERGSRSLRLAEIMLRRFDDDDNGFLSPAEWRRQPASDQDGDGLISVEELARHYDENLSRSREWTPTLPNGRD